VTSGVAAVRVFNSGVGVEAVAVDVMEVTGICGVQAARDRTIIKTSVKILWRAVFTFRTFVCTSHFLRTFIHPPNNVAYRVDRIQD
jgi:hypothetical protein